MSMSSTLVFGNDKKVRGCFIRINLNTTSGLGARIILPDGSTEMPTATGTNSPDARVVVGIGFAQKEKVHLVQCFQDTTYTYAFGNDPSSSMINVNFIHFLINYSKCDQDDKSSDAINKTLDNYEDARISKSLNYAKLQIGDTVLQGFIVGVNSATVDPHYNLQTVNIDMLAVEPLGRPGGGLVIAGSGVGGTSASPFAGAVV